MSYFKGIWIPISDNEPETQDALRVPRTERTLEQQTTIDAKWQRNREELAQKYESRKIDNKKLENQLVKASRFLEAEIRQKRNREAMFRRQFRFWIYFIRRPSDGAIKIGYTGRFYINARFYENCKRERQELEFLGAFEADRKREKALHKAFAKFHIEGEWFEPAKTILAHIDIICIRKSLMSPAQGSF